MPWLDRVALQLEPEVKEAEKKYDYKSSRADLETSKILGLIISTSRPPSYHQTGFFNTHTVTHHHHHTHVANPPTSDSAKSKTEKKETEKKEVNWKNIALLTFVGTAITSVSVFVYTRLAKTEQKAKNYLEKTNMIKQFAETSTFQNNNTGRLKIVADAQQKIDQNALDKIKGYKHATLAALAGTVATTAGAIAMPWFATASTVVIIAGMTFTAGSAVYATYNLASHWDDATEAQERLNEVKNHLTQLRDPNSYLDLERASFYEAGASSSQFAYNPYYTEEQPPYYTQEPPPSYNESQQQYGYGYIAAESVKPTAPIYPKIPEDLNY